MHKAANRPLNPSASTPPWILLSNKGPSTSSLLTSQVAEMSPIASIMRTMYTASKGKTIGPYTVRGKVLTQMKLAAGAAVMPALEK